MVRSVCYEFEFRHVESQIAGEYNISFKVLGRLDWPVQAFMYGKLLYLRDSYELFKHLWLVNVWCWILTIATTEQIVAATYY